MSRAFGGGVLSGSRLVRILYLDEAGISNAKQEPFVVVSGVIIHGDVDWKPLESDLKNIVETLVPEHLRDGFVIHAKRLICGGREIDPQGWPLSERVKVLTEVVKLIPKYCLPVVVGSVNREKFRVNASTYVAEDGGTYTKEDLEEPSLTRYTHLCAFMDCMYRADWWMKTYAPDELAMIIAEDQPAIRSLLRLASRRARDPLNALYKIQSRGMKLEPIGRIVEDLNFTEKSGSSILQIADACAYIFKRMLMAKDHIQHYLPHMVPYVQWMRTMRDETSGTPFSAPQNEPSGPSS